MAERLPKGENTLDVNYSHEIFAHKASAAGSIDTWSVRSDSNLPEETAATAATVPELQAEEDVRFPLYMILKTFPFTSVGSRGNLQLGHW